MCIRDRGETPAFENITVTVDGETEVSWGGHFYDGIVDGEEGTLVYGDGTSLDTDSDGVLIPRYVGEDGSMEYHIVCLLYTSTCCCEFWLCIAGCGIFRVYAEAVPGGQGGTD